MRFECFGGEARVQVSGSGAGGAGSQGAAGVARERLLEFHRRMSRFNEDSELSRLNADPRGSVPASVMMRRFVDSVISAGRRSGGLVDATLTGALETAGYRCSLRGAQPVALQEALRAAPSRRAALPHVSKRWRSLRVDDVGGTVSRPAGLRLDSGGLGKGLAADLVAALLRDHPAFAVDSCGDVRIGGRSALPRPVGVKSPFDATTIHEFELRRGGVATSGIGRSSWLGEGGEPMHHLLDPSTGRPAYTGIVQATALAPTALLAEVYAKTALLSGPERAAEWLPHGGVLVTDENDVRVVRADRTEAEPERTGTAGR